VRTTEEINDMIQELPDTLGIHGGGHLVNILSALNEQIAALHLGQQALNDGAMGEIAGIKALLDELEIAWNRQQMQLPAGQRQVL